MSISFVQSRSTSGGTSSLSLSFNSPVTGGNAIIVTALCSLAPSSPTISDGTNVYSSLAELTFSSAATVSVRIFYAFNVAAGSPSITVTAGAGSVLAIAIHEFSGINAFDQTNSGSTTANSQPSGNITTNFASELLFGFTGMVLAAGTVTSSTPDAAFTLGERILGANAILTEYEIVSSTGTFSFTSTNTVSKGGGTPSSIAQIASFYQSAADPATKARFFVMF